MVSHCDTTGGAGGTDGAFLPSCPGRGRRLTPGGVCSCVFLLQRITRKATAAATASNITKIKMNLFEFVNDEEVADDTGASVLDTGVRPDDTGGSVVGISSVLAGAGVEPAASKPITTKLDTDEGSSELTSVFPAATKVPSFPPAIPVNQSSFSAPSCSVNCVSRT